MNNKGVVSVPLAVGILICIALIVVIGIFVIKSTAEAATYGSNKIAVRDLATLIDTSYAAPENLEAIYDVEIGPDGYPIIGTLALANGYDRGGRDVSEVCISKYEENEMWLNVLNAVLIPWGLASTTHIETTIFRLA